MYLHDEVLFSKSSVFVVNKQQEVFKKGTLALYKALPYLLGMAHTTYELYQMLAPLCLTRTVCEHEVHLFRCTDESCYELPVIDLAFLNQYETDLEKQEALAVHIRASY